jgi:hypothetical protein
MATPDLDDRLLRLCLREMIRQGRGVPQNWQNFAEIVISRVGGAGD